MDMSDRNLHFVGSSLVELHAFNSKQEFSAFREQVSVEVLYECRKCHTRENTVLGICQHVMCCALPTQNKNVVEEFKSILAETIHNINLGDASQDVLHEMNKYTKDEKCISHDQHENEFKESTSCTIYSQKGMWTRDKTKTIKEIHNAAERPQISTYHKSHIKNAGQRISLKKKILVQKQPEWENCKNFIREKRDAKQSEGVRFSLKRDGMEDGKSTSKGIGVDSKASTEIRARTCGYCMEIFATVEDALKHYEEVHPNTLWNVTRSSSSERRQTLLKIHNLLKIGHESKDDSSVVPAIKSMKQCDYCRKSVPYQEYLHHISLIHYWKPAMKIQGKIVSDYKTCHICGKIIKHTLADHMRQVHEGKKRPRWKGEPKIKMCSQCGYTTPQGRRLRWHVMSAHEGIMPFKCTVCDYGTWEESSLRDHMYRHQDQKRFKCDHCTYQCIQRKQLRSHMNKHHNIDLPKRWMSRRQREAMDKGLPIPDLPRKISRLVNSDSRSKIVHQNDVPQNPLRQQGGSLDIQTDGSNNNIHQQLLLSAEYTQSSQGSNANIYIFGGNELQASSSAHEMCAVKEYSLIRNDVNSQPVSTSNKLEMICHQDNDQAQHLSQLVDIPSQVNTTQLPVFEALAMTHLY